MHPVDFEKSTSGIILLAIISTLFTGLGAFLVFVIAPDVESTLVTIIGLIPMLFCGIFGPYAIYQIIKAPPVLLRVTQTGFTSFRKSDQEVSWNDIKTVRRVEVRGIEMVNLIFTDDYAKRENMSVLMRDTTLSPMIFNTDIETLYNTFSSAHAAFHEN